MRGVEAMQSHTSARAASRVLRALWLVRSIISDEKMRSIAELSRTLPARPMAQVMPLSAGRRWNCAQVALRPLVRVMQRCGSLAAAPDGHHQGVHDQPGIAPGLPWPARHAAGHCRGLA